MIDAHEHGDQEQPEKDRFMGLLQLELLSLEIAHGSPDDGTPRMVLGAAALCESLTRISEMPQISGWYKLVLTTSHVFRRGQVRI